MTDERKVTTITVLQSVLEAVDTLIPIKYRNRSTFIEEAMQEKLERET